MNITMIARDLAVSPQLEPDDGALAARRGFRSLIINRPDGEADDQPPHTEIAAAAGHDISGLRTRLESAGKPSSTVT